MRHSVIVVPGIMGSEIWLRGERIWPGPLTSLIGDYPWMDKLADPEAGAGDLIRSYIVAAGKGEQYGALLSALEAMGFDEYGEPKTLCVCPYDWRRSNRDSAEVLATELDRAIEQTPGEISIVAHSMGGLVARYYLESGRFGGRPAFSKVRALVTLGTPHRGAPEALLGILGKRSKVFLSGSQVKELASLDSVRSVYELLPPPGEPFCWDKSADSQYAAVDIYSDQWSQRLGLSADHLASAISFRKSLDAKKNPVRCFHFASGGHTTIAAVEVMDFFADGGPEGIERSAAGDGTVPAWSAFEPGVQREFTGGEHSVIFKDKTLQRTLAKVLGATLRLAAGAEVEVSLSVANQIGPPDKMLETVLSSLPSSGLDTRILIHRISLTEEGPGTLVAEYPLNYTGPQLLSIAFSLPRPQDAGLFRISLADTSASAEFFVTEN